MITDLHEARAAVRLFLARNPTRLFTAHELAGEVDVDESWVRVVLSDFLIVGRVVRVGEKYQGPDTGEERP